jgi:hypothetical protein
MLLSVCSITDIEEHPTLRKSSVSRVKRLMRLKFLGPYLATKFLDTKDAI